MERGAKTVQLAEGQNTPAQSPQLIGVGKRDAATDTDVFGGVLLEDITDHPDKAAQHEPEENAFGDGDFVPEWKRATRVKQGNGQHHRQLANGEESHER